MNPLPEEEKIIEVLTKAKNIFPFLRIPPLQNINLFVSHRADGLGGEYYGIGLNVDVRKDNFTEVVIHELVHFQGIHGHGPAFHNLYNHLMKELEV